MLNPLLSAELDTTSGSPLTLILYSKNNCVQCTALKRAFERARLTKAQLAVDGDSFLDRLFVDYPAGAFLEINIEELDDIDSDLHRNWIKSTFGPQMPLAIVFDSKTGEPVVARSGNRPDFANQLAEVTSGRGFAGVTDPVRAALKSVTDHC